MRTAHGSTDLSTWLLPSAAELRKLNHPGLAQPLPGTKLGLTGSADGVHDRNFGQCLLPLPTLLTSAGATCFKLCLSKSQHQLLGSWVGARCNEAICIHRCKERGLRCVASARLVSKQPAACTWRGPRCLSTGSFSAKSVKTTGGFKLAALAEHSACRKNPATRVDILVRRQNQLLSSQQSNYANLVSLCGGPIDFADSLAGRSRKVEFSLGSAQTSQAPVSQGRSRKARKNLAAPAPRHLPSSQGTATQLVKNPPQE